MNKLTPRETIDKAKDILIQKNLAKGMKESLAKDLAHYAMYGMLSVSVSAKKAKECLEIAEGWE